MYCAAICKLQRNTADSIEWKVNFTGSFFRMGRHQPFQALPPLHLAASGGHAAVVEQLLAVGAVVDAKDEVRGGRAGG